MTSNGWGQRTVTLHTSHVVFALLCLLTIGVLVGLNLPFGAKPVTVAKGRAELAVDGDGSFQADRGGVTAYLPHQVSWTDGTTQTSSSVPPCLRVRKGEPASAPVEAGYVEVRYPDGGSSYQVAWIRCL